MADRSARIITKQTAVPGRIPTGTTGYEDNFIRQGEVAQNTSDKKIFGFNGSNVFEFGINSFVYLTGGTISGNLITSGNLSAGTLYSGSTNLYDIFATSASGGNPPFGSDYEIQINSGGTFYSKSNFIYDYDSDNFSVGGGALFGPLSTNNSNINSIASTFGSNTRNSVIMGGELNSLTATDSIILGGHLNTIDSDNSSGSTISGGFRNRVDAQDSSIIGGKLNYINTGLTGVTIVASSGVTATTSYSLYAQDSYLAHQNGAIYSAGTNLYDIFVTAAGASDITRVQPGVNTYTGGTSSLPTINISAATLSYLSATTISGDGVSITGIKGAFGITIDGSGSVLTTGQKGFFIVPYNLGITGWDIVANTTGNCAIDIWKNTTFPTVSDSITGTQKPMLSDNQFQSNPSPLTTWTTGLTSGDIIVFNLISATTISKLTLSVRTIKN